MNFEDLIDKLDYLEPLIKESGKSLEEYWRSIYPLIRKNRNQIPTLQLFCRILEEGIDNDPIPLEENWLLVKDPPYSNIFEDDFSLEEFAEGKIQAEFAGADFLLKVLEFQIAELIRMKDKQLKNKYRYFGLDSETGHRWFNFDPISILDGGVSGMLANGFHEDTRNWVVLGELIEMGRIYE